MIRVLIADDHGVVRDGLGRLVEALPDMELVGLAADGEEAVERAARRRAGRRAHGPRHAAPGRDRGDPAAARRAAATPPCSS